MTQATDPFGSPPGSGERARIAAERLPTVGQWPGVRQHDWKNDGGMRYCTGCHLDYWREYEGTECTGKHHVYICAGCHGFYGVRQDPPVTDYPGDDFFRGARENCEFCQNQDDCGQVSWEQRDYSKETAWRANALVSLTNQAAEQAMADKLLELRPS